MSKIHSELLYAVVSLACAVTGSVFDLRDRRIPNLLTLPCVVFGLVLHLALDGWKGLGYSAAAGAIAFGVFLIFWLAGGMGAGDVKLITATGCILGGSMHVLWLLIYTALAGGVMAIGLALWRGRLKDTLMNLGALVLHHRFEGLKPHPQLNVGNAQTLRLPYALAIAAGSAATVCMMVVLR